jgi:hypothetical protein
MEPSTTACSCLESSFAASAVDEGRGVSDLEKNGQLPCFFSFFFFCFAVVMDGLVGSVRTELTETEIPQFLVF